MKTPTFSCTQRIVYYHTLSSIQTLKDTSTRNIPSLSQQRRCSASFCIRVLTERAAGVSDLVFVCPFSRGWANEALLDAVTCDSEVTPGERWLVEFEGTGCTFSILEAWVSVLLEQSLFDGDGFVLGFAVQVGVFKQISIQIIKTFSDCTKLQCKQS